MLYSKQQLAALWVKNGGSPAKAGIAAEVAWAEAHGGSNATHMNADGSIDRGLWQINSVHGAQSSTDPNINARAAITISRNGEDWSPWVTYQRGTTKAIRDYKATGTMPVGFSPLDPLLGPLGLPKDLLNGANSLLGGVPGDALNGAGNLAQSILPDSVVNFFKLGIAILRNILSADFYLRAGKVILGTLLGLMAVNAIIKRGTGTSPVQVATKTAKQAKQVAALAA